MLPHKEPHRTASSSRTNWLRAAVLGSNDGIISLAALLVGVAGASTSSHVLLVTGIAGILAGALSMAIGEYVSVSSQRDTEHALLEKERGELLHSPEEELKELVHLYELKGLSPNTARAVAQELTNKDALAVHAEVELGIDPENLSNPLHAAVASALAFTAGGVIPIIAILIPSEPYRVAVTFAAVFFALVGTGVLSAVASGSKLGRPTFRIVLGGVVAMAITFGIGKILGVSAV